MSNKKGFSLIAAIFVLLIMVLFTLTVASFLSADAVVAAKNHNSLRAFYIASTGLEYYFKQMDDDDDWSTPPLGKTGVFKDGAFSITTTDESKNRLTFTVTGLYTVEGTTYRRALRPTIQRTAGGIGDILGDYVLYWGGNEGDGSYIANNATIIGDIYTGATLEIGSNVNISGDATSSGDITTGSGTTVDGTIETYIEPPFNPPSLETTYYDDQLAIAATYPLGNQTWTTKSLSGTIYINGNLTMDNNADINLTGVATVVVTGWVLVRNNADVGDGIHVTAGGMITIENNAVLGMSQVWYSSIGFDVGNNAEVGEVEVGEGTSFLTPGDINFGNNIEFYGFIFCEGNFTQTGNNFYFEGNMIVGGDIMVDNNSTLVLNPYLVDVDALEGVGGTEGEETIDMTGWDEVY
ncbi:MAG: hypothetical protein JW782_01720 [Candidatus Saganbacteria bacterium]|nr:hypothetical protein [Candidatus Saganbacteria bacterium]